jgi:hypothetical protein
VPRICGDAGVNGLNVGTLAFKHLSKIAFGGEESAGDMDRLVVSARHKQDVGESRTAARGASPGKERRADIGQTEQSQWCHLAQNRVGGKTCQPTRRIMSGYLPRSAVPLGLAQTAGRLLPPAICGKPCFLPVSTVLKGYFSFMISLL